jgi:hypothetical protein
VIKSRRMRWARHAARKGQTRNTQKILIGKPPGMRSLGNLNVNGRIILRVDVK